MIMEKDLKIKLSKFEEKGQSLEESMKQLSKSKLGQIGGRLPPSCMWYVMLYHNVKYLARRYGMLKYFSKQNGYIWKRIVDHWR